MSTEIRALPTGIAENDLTRYTEIIASYTSALIAATQSRDSSVVSNPSSRASEAINSLLSLMHAGKVILQTA